MSIAAARIEAGAAAANTVEMKSANRTRSDMTAGSGS